MGRCTILAGLLFLSWAGLGALGIGSARGDMIEQLSSRGGLTDTINWGQLGSIAPYVGNDVPVTSTNGVNATITGPTGGFYLSEQGFSFFGDFNLGDVLMQTGNIGGSGKYGPATIVFASPVQAVVTQVEADAVINTGYSGSLTAYTPGGVELGSYTYSGVARGNSNNSAAFAGIEDLSGAHIGSIVISDNATSGSAADFAINQLSLLDGTAAPLPSSLRGAIVLLGICLLGGLRRRAEV